MLTRISAISSLLLAFAISGCGWFADYELKIVDTTLKDATEATKAKVEIRKKGESDLLEEGTGHDLAITLSVECGEADPKEYKDKKADKGFVEITLEGLPGEKGNDCTAEATADDAKSHEVTFKRG